MNTGSFILIVIVAFIIWCAWLWWNNDLSVPKRKNEDLYPFAEKPKRNRIIEPENETFEHTQEIDWDAEAVKSWTTRYDNDNTQKLFETDRDSKK